VSKGKSTKISIHSREFFSIIQKFGQRYGLLPYFKVRISKELYIDQWGVIVLPRIIKNEFLHPDEKFYLIISLGYHGISPKREIYRLLQRIIIAKIINQDWRSPMISWLSGFFSTLYVLSEITKDEYIFRRVRDVYYWLQKTLESIEKRTVLEEFFLNYIQILRGYLSEDTELSRKAKNVIEILQSNLPYHEKVKSTFRILKSFITKLKSPKNMGNVLRNIIVPIGKPNEQDKEIWGKNIKSEREGEKDLTPNELSEIAKLDYKIAMNLAKKLDKKIEENAEKLFKGGKLPGFSDRLRMYQKLSRYRRYVYAVRKVRMSEVLLSFPLKYDPRYGLSPRGLADWEIDDDPERLDIEASIENYGRVIPGLSTLKRFYEYSKEGGIGDSKHFEIILDTSGSMDGEPLEKAIEITLALIEFAKSWEYSIALITFSSGAWEALPPSYDYDFVEDIVLRLLADGGTNLRGALKILDEHLSIISNSPLIFFITDTAIWDISTFSVKMKIRELAQRYPTYLIAITDELYEDTKYSLRESGIKLIFVNPKGERVWELVLDEFVKL